MSSLNPVKEKKRSLRGVLFSVLVGVILCLFLSPIISPFITLASLGVPIKSQPILCNNSLLEEEISYLSSKNQCFEGIKKDIHFVCLSHLKDCGYTYPNNVVVIGCQERYTVAHELFHVLQNNCVSFNESDIFVVEGTASLYADSRERMDCVGDYPDEYGWLVEGLNQSEKDYALDLMLSGDVDMGVNRVEAGGSEVLEITYKQKQVFGDCED